MAMLRISGLVLVALCGCGWMESLACDDDCEGGFGEIEGTRDDFMLAELDDARGVVSDATVCEDDDYTEVHVVQVSTRGTEEVAPAEWIFDRLQPELQTRDIRTTGTGLGACTTGDPGIRVSTDDWKTVDVIAETILDLAQRDDVQVHVTVAIEPVPIACPQDACGL